MANDYRCIYNSRNFNSVFDQVHNRYTLLSTTVEILIQYLTSLNALLYTLSTTVEILIQYLTSFLWENRPNLQQ